MTIMSEAIAATPLINSILADKRPWVAMNNLILLRELILDTSKFISHRSIDASRREHSIERL
jgi:hypothetical protein